MLHKIRPSRIGGHVVAPPSKSHTMRALVFALLAKGECRISRYLPSPDTSAMIKALRLFGAEIEVFEDELIVRGELKAPGDILQAGNSGLVFRFASALALLLDRYVVITGDASIRSRRVIQPLLEAVNENGAFGYALAGNGHAPILLKGPLSPGSFHVDGEDSQIVSALLLATIFLNGESKIHVTNPGEEPWVELTLSWIRSLGGQVTHKEYREYTISGGLSYEGFRRTIPGDFSSATYPLALGFLSRKKIIVGNLQKEDAQADKHFLEILEKMGATITWQKDQVVLETGKRIRGVLVNVNKCIDTVPLLATVACFADSPTKITGARIARYKESDRIAAITCELRKMGAVIEEEEDGMTIFPSALKGSRIFAHQDHRIALSLVVAAAHAKGESVLEGGEVIKKSYPAFFSVFRHLGGDFEQLDFDRDERSREVYACESV